MGGVPVSGPASAARVQYALEARVGERTRIARELHDTLLQSFHGLLLRFQTVSFLLPKRPAEAKEKLDVAIEQAAKAITEGRDAVQGLRAATVERNDLAVAIRTLGDELATEASAHQPSDIRCRVEGEHARAAPSCARRDLQDCRGSAAECFRHAHAGRIEVEMHYDDEQFRLRVRDNGRGIDKAAVASHETPGHFGLRGMTERAALIGGTLAVWSGVDEGTELELRLPANIAYDTIPKRSWWLRRLAKASTRAEGDAS